MALRNMCWEELSLNIDSHDAIFIIPSRKRSERSKRTYRDHWSRNRGPYSRICPPLRWIQKRYNHYEGFERWWCLGEG